MNLLDMSGPFEPEMIANLPQLSIQQLSKLEECISEEFASLAQEYVAARKSRVEYMQKNVESQIKKFQHNDSSWSNFYNQQVQLIETLSTLTENSVIKDNSSSRHHNKYHHASALDFEKELQQLMASLELPLDFDDVFKHRMGDLPFAEYFREIVDLHKAQLVALMQLNRYQSDLIETITEKNKVILWKQYREDVLEYKNKLINETRQELENLHNEYHGINSNASVANTNMHYYRSVVPVEISKSDSRHGAQRLLSTKIHDKYHGVDNIYYRNNRVEITDTKIAAQKRYREFSQQQNKYKIPQLNTVSVKLGGCLGLTKEELDADLALIRLHDPTFLDEYNQSDEIMRGEDLDFSSYGREVPYDSEEEDYRDILNADRQPTKVHTGKDD